MPQFFTQVSAQALGCYTGNVRTKGLLGPHLSRGADKIMTEGKQVGGVVRNVMVGDVVGGGCRTHADGVLEEPLSEQDAARLVGAVAKIDGFGFEVRVLDVKPGVLKIALMVDRYPPDPFSRAQTHERAARELEGKRFTA